MDAAATGTIVRPQPPRGAGAVPSLALALRAYEFWVAQYRRVWRGTVITSVVNPVLYLGALGIGLGTLVNRRTGNGLGVPYVDFVAPGMLAAAAMQIATIESSWPVMSGIKWTRNYFAQLATPLRVQDVLAGHQLWIATRIAMTTTVYLVVIAAFGAVDSPLGVLAMPAGLLLGMAFAAPVAALAAYVDNDSAFTTLFRFAITPMFLFSGTFFPVSRLPGVLQPVAWLTPLWHGVELCRGLTLGTIGGLAALGHVAYLLLWTLGGLVLAWLAYRRRLVR